MKKKKCHLIQIKYGKSVKNKNENILALKKIIDEANDFSKTRKDITITDFVDYLTMIQQDRDLDILIDKPDIVQDAVQLTTYHS